MIRHLIQVSLILTCITSSAYAISSTQVQIQDTQGAFQYFENKLNYTANPSTMKKVSEGKIEGVIIDLRKKDDFERGHVPGAINIPFDIYDGFEGKQTEFPGLSKDKINYLYCYELLCNLSQKAAKKFASLGFPVKEVEGGFKEWVSHNYPVEELEK